MLGTTAPTPPGEGAVPQGHRMWHQLAGGGSAAAGTGFGPCSVASAPLGQMPGTADLGLRSFGSRSPGPRKERRRQLAGRPSPLRGAATTLGQADGTSSFGRWRRAPRTSASAPSGAKAALHGQWVLRRLAGGGSCARALLEDSRNSVSILLGRDAESHGRGTDAGSPARGPCPPDRKDDASMLAEGFRPTERLRFARMKDARVQRTTGLGLPRQA